MPPDPAPVIPPFKISGYVSALAIVPEDISGRSAIYRQTQTIVYSTYIA